MNQRPVNTERSTAEAGVQRMHEVIAEAVASGKAVILVTEDDMVTIANDPHEIVKILEDSLEIAIDETPDGGREESGMMLS